MHFLKGSFVKRKEPEEMKLESGETKMGYPLKLVFSKKRARVIFFETDQEKKDWRMVFKEASGSSDILDFYELKEKLGEGQFGVVFKGMHLESKQEVAIKTANKTEMDSDTLSFNRKEIETLKTL